LKNYQEMKVIVFPEPAESIDRQIRTGREETKENKIEEI